MGGAVLGMFILAVFANRLRRANHLPGPDRAPICTLCAHVSTAVWSITGVLVFSFVPFNLGLLLAALLAMIAGAEVERRITKRSAG